MFTGIIEEIGQIKEITRAKETLCLNIVANVILEDIKLGDSISVNGVCLTVTSFTNKSFTADVMPITFRDTTLHNLSRGSNVNLERAMAANGRFGGHIVSGHIDGTAKITHIQQNQNAVIYSIQMTNELIKYCIVKGSIAIDGTSLTISAINGTQLQVSLIPHTREKSILGMKNTGEYVNIECDMLMKKPSQNIANSNINENFLREHGFI